METSREIGNCIKNYENIESGKKQKELLAVWADHVTIWGLQSLINLMC